MSAFGILWSGKIHVLGAPVLCPLVPQKIRPSTRIATDLIVAASIKATKRIEKPSATEWGLTDVMLTSINNFLYTEVLVKGFQSQACDFLVWNLLVLVFHQKSANSNYDNVFMNHIPYLFLISCFHDQYSD